MADYRNYTMELAGKTLSIDIGRVGKQANGCAFMHYGETTVLCTATASKQPREGIDFFPLSVEYEEKFYAAGKMPGGFNKREGKPSENAILTSRVIDRPMRPLFPKDYRNDVTLDAMVMAVDPECRPELTGMLGCALATTISQVLSAGMVLNALRKEEGACKLEFKKLRVYPDKLKQLIRIGLPAGMQGIVFSISNVLIQSSINSFGHIAMAGSTAAASIEGFVYVSMNSMHQTAISFISQNYGAGQWDRIKKIALYCLGMVTVIGLVMGIGAYAGSGWFLTFYSDKPEVIAYGMERLLYIATPYCICGWMDTMVGIIRGLGYSVLPTIVSLIGACGLRIIWIYSIFIYVHTLPCLFISYPVSWLLTAAAHATCLFFIIRKVKPGQRTGAM